ncbi:MAG: peptidase [Pseudomonas sp.]|nr:peptidase [Pseudomonas sp.]
MHSVNFGKHHEPGFVLQKSEDLLIVRSCPGCDLYHPHNSAVVAKALRGARSMMNMIQSGVQVFKVPAAAQSLKERIALLRTLKAVRFAGKVMVNPATQEPVIYTENIFIKFVDTLNTQDCLSILASEGLSIKEQVPYATNAYFVTPGEGIGTQVFALATALLSSPEVDYCHPELLRQKRKRGIHPNQWHLKKTTHTNGAEIDASANVEAAHYLSQGEGVIIAVIDDAIDIDHPEFAGDDKIVAPYNFGAGDSVYDPRPLKGRDENHGTSVAGVACANGLEGASGVAPAARLMPLKQSEVLGDKNEALAFYWASEQGADIICCSWGPSDGAWDWPNDPRHRSIDPLPASTRLALEYATNKGRKGKGCVIFFAAGNGGEPVDNDGYASNKYVSAVAACNDQGRRSVYSDHGLAILCSFPSNDFPSRLRPVEEHPLTPGIRTTDIVGDLGYSSGTAGDPQGNYADDFGGTSSACPGAAGVAALMLSLNPNLSRVEVVTIMADTCDKIGHPSDGPLGEYDANGRSHYYGYGRLNARRAVDLVLKQLLDGHPV